MYLKITAVREYSIDAEYKYPVAPDCRYKSRQSGVCFDNSNYSVNFAHI